MDAIKAGADVSVCGDCPLRLNPKTGKKLCYVTQRRPSGVYRSYTNDKLPIVKIDARSNIWFDLKPLRIGSYGDPTAIPIEVWTDWVGLLKSRKIRHTGYTRRWENPENQGFRKFLMASVFSDEEQELASSMGWRTYRILPKGVAVPPNQILCPGSKEAGLLKTCRECLMCGGTSRRSDVAVYAHGYNESLFTGVS